MLCLPEVRSQSGKNDHSCWEGSLQQKVVSWKVVDWNPSLKLNFVYSLLLFIYGLLNWGTNYCTLKIISNKSHLLVTTYLLLCDNAIKKFYFIPMPANYFKMKYLLKCPCMMKVWVEQLYSWQVLGEKKRSSTLYFSRNLIFFTPPTEKQRWASKMISLIKGISDRLKTKTNVC